MLLIFLLLLTSCSQAHEPIAHVLVPINSSVRLPDKPYLPVYTITDDSTPDQVVKAYVASIYDLKGYSEALEKINEGYE